MSVLRTFSPGQRSSGGRNVILDLMLSYHSNRTLTLAVVVVCVTHPLNFVTLLNADFDSILSFLHLIYVELS